MSDREDARTPAEGQKDGERETPTKEPTEFAYVYIDDFEATNPVTRAEGYRAVALDKRGDYVADIFLPKLSSDNEVRRFLLARVTEMDLPYRFVYVEQPNDHPVLCHLVARYRNETPQEPDEPQGGLVTPQEALRNEHHLCTSCRHEPVCVFTNHQLSPVVTIAGCQHFEHFEHKD